MKMKKRIVTIIVTTVFLLATTIAAICERATWDCPECGKTGNTGKFCGGCGHSALTSDGGSSKKTGNVVFEVGDIISFGTYPQNIEGTDLAPIEWIVLEIRNGEALLLSKYGLTAKQYHTNLIDITWEECTLRNWLNNDFLKSAFSDKEQSMILYTNSDNSGDQGYSNWDTTGGNNTKDQVFILSYAEANKYLDVTVDDDSNMKSRVSPTVYARTQGAGTTSKYKTNDGDEAGWWWLRSPGIKQNNAAYIDNDGALRSRYVYGVNGIVRPALWVKLESDIF